MVSIEEYRNRKHNDDQQEYYELFKILGWMDEDGTLIVEDEDWPDVAGLPGFRKITKIDRKRQERLEYLHPDLVARAYEIAKNSSRYI